MARGKPTIYAALVAKLGREPTHDEIKADVRRILNDAWRERIAAAHGIGTKRAGR